MNILCPYIKKIYLFMESNEDIEYVKSKIDGPGNKIQLILWNKQPTYRDYLNLANNLRAELCMISNADIWLKACDNSLLDIINKRPRIAYSLTRHEHNGKTPMIDGFCSTMMSHDSFIFRSPIYVHGDIDHVQNRPGSEHVFKYVLEKAGIHFLNPCRDIVIVHEHASSHRTYTRNEDLLWQRDASGNWYWPYALVCTPPVSGSEVFVRQKLRGRSLFMMKMSGRKR